MKHSLQLKLSQHLTLTPQLQQSIRLLQLSTVELNQELERYLAENPLLERADLASPDELRPPPVNGESVDQAPPTAAEERRDESPSLAEEHASFGEDQGSGSGSGSSSMMRPVPTARPSAAPTGSCSRTRRFSFGSTVRSPRTRSVMAAPSETKPAGTVTVPDCAA